MSAVFGSIINRIKGVGPYGSNETKNCSLERQKDLQKKFQHYKMAEIEDSEFSDRWTVVLAEMLEEEKKEKERQVVPPQEDSLPVQNNQHVVDNHRADHVEGDPNKSLNQLLEVNPVQEIQEQSANYLNFLDNFKIVLAEDFKKKNEHVLKFTYTKPSGIVVSNNETIVSAEIHLFSKEQIEQIKDLYDNFYQQFEKFDLGKVNNDSDLNVKALKLMTANFSQKLSDIIDFNSLQKSIESRLNEKDRYGRFLYKDWHCTFAKKTVEELVKNTVDKFSESITLYTNALHQKDN